MNTWKISCSFFRLIFGWVGDRSISVRFFLGGAVLTLGGVVSCFSPFYTTYNLMVLYSILFGAFTGRFFMFGHSYILFDVLWRYTHTGHKNSRPIFFFTIGSHSKRVMQNCCVGSLSKISHPNMMLIYYLWRKLTSFLNRILI